MWRSIRNKVLGDRIHVASLHRNKRIERHFILIGPSDPPKDWAEGDEEPKGDEEPEAMKVQRDEDPEAVSE